MTPGTNPAGVCGAADIAAVLAPQVPGASLQWLTAQIAALKLLPRHAAGLLQYLQFHPYALTAGDPTGPSALRALLDVLAAEYPGVQRTRCHGCGAQRTLCRQTSCEHLSSPSVDHRVEDRRRESRWRPA